MPDDVFRWVIAGGVLLACIAFLVQTGIVIALYRVVSKTQTRVLPLMDHAEPILNATRQILEENRPRISEISVEAVEIAKTARVQADRIGDLLSDGALRAKTRLAQIDKTVDDTVEQVEHVGEFMKGAVLKPVKEMNGLVAGMKAAISTYAANASRRPSVDHATQDEEMFI